MAPDPCPPEPAAAFDPLPAALPRGTVLFRIHSPRFGASAFNPWTGPAAKPTRFAPFSGAKGAPVPTLYAAASFAVALAETLFHDLPRDAADLVVAASRLDELALSRLETRRELRLASFRGASLRRLRIDWNRLVGSPLDCWDQTRKWARAAHRHAARFDGIEWSSRQYDGEPCLLLFGDRRAATRALAPLDDAIPLADARLRELVLAECEAAGVTLVSA